MSEFWKESIDGGYYDKVLTLGLSKNKGIQANWHNLTFLKVKNYLDSNKKHLDYACGSGTLIGLYSEAESIGFDISERQIHYANKKYNQKANFYLISELNFEKNLNKYDVITVLGLLEFLDNRGNIEIINNLHTLLKPNGKLILTTPNFTSTMYLLEKLINIFGGVSYQSQHINKLNKSKLSLLLNQTNFNKIKVQKIINFPVFLSFINIKLAVKFNSLIEKISNNKVGYLLLAELTK
ncbi:class I SAM-dependent methyltransferase [Acidimicrobiia bacterium]|jgi:2-polyprenyl-3-methyl-5-hydroxy-6-metoxy-1,4-benzoquinol methylase|nr:class I SAM-dependent methyltransferase [Acidimicrobiia bacterium]